MPSSSESNNSHDRSMIWRSGIMFNCFDRITAIFRATTGSPHARALLMTSAFFSSPWRTSCLTYQSTRSSNVIPPAACMPFTSVHQCTCGSSPRLRGTLREREHRHAFVGIIPALAGNTASTRSPARPSRDHPRACGEHRDFDIDYGHTVGSSPRLRGTHKHANQSLNKSGIIPALAGNTTRRFSSVGC